MQIFGGMLFIPRLLPKRLDGTGPNTIILPRCIARHSFVSQDKVMHLCRPISTFAFYLFYERSLARATAGAGNDPTRRLLMDYIGLYVPVSQVRGVSGAAQLVRIVQQDERPVFLTRRRRPYEEVMVSVTVFIAGLTTPTVAAALSV